MNVYIENSVAYYIFAETLKNIYNYLIELIKYASNIIKHSRIHNEFTLSISANKNKNKGLIDVRRKRKRHRK
ncbi:MAG: hypothetical protein ACI88H_001112 [Cocleimonas sp.]|jgi:hypothetical protein